MYNYIHAANSFVNIYIVTAQNILIGGEEGNQNKRPGFEALSSLIFASGAAAKGQDTLDSWWW